MNNYHQNYLHLVKIKKSTNFSLSQMMNLNDIQKFFFFINSFSLKFMFAIIVIVSFSIVAWISDKVKFGYGKNL